MNRRVFRKRREISGVVERLAEVFSSGWSLRVRARREQVGSVWVSLLCYPQKSFQAGDV